MSNVYQLKPGSYRAVADAALRAAEFADAMRCIEKIIGPDEEPVALISNDLRGLMKLLTREAEAIGMDMTDLL